MITIFLKNTMYTADFLLKSHSVSKSKLTDCSLRCGLVIRQGSSQHYSTGTTAPMDFRGREEKFEIFINNVLDLAFFQSTFNDSKATIFFIGISNSRVKSYSTILVRCSLEQNFSISTSRNEILTRPLLRFGT